ncbi:hypothetical protein [Larkinella soli]|uniref:hypothetical protein n=1 Tax=Larkinella soli TaxID=1770527 RepID=UPI000FFC987B|nr:hypothetical protein [Larkinella soli]
MKTIEIDERGFAYKLLYSSSEYGGWARQYVIGIEWHYHGQLIRIDIQNESLFREQVSPDGQYLVLIFYQNKQYPDPCNCVVYNPQGQIHRIVCAPYLVSEQAIAYHQGNRQVLGLIRGASIRKNATGEEVMFLGIYDPEEYYHSHAFYFESREFNPETGEIGPLLGVSLELR